MATQQLVHDVHDSAPDGRHVGETKTTDGHAQYIMKGMKDEDSHHYSKWKISDTKPYTVQLFTGKV